MSIPIEYCVDPYNNTYVCDTLEPGPTVIDYGTPMCSLLAFNAVGTHDVVPCTDVPVEDTAVNLIPTEPYGGCNTIVYCDANGTVMTTPDCNHECAINVGEGLYNETTTTVHYANIGTAQNPFALPNTGIDSTPLIVVGVIFVIVGVWLRRFSRRGV